jgi:ABC-type transport system substrate-binding protein
MWRLATLNSVPDGQDILARWYGPQSGLQNYARFSRPEFDAVYRRMLPLPNGPEREALFREAKRIAVAWMPYKVHVHRITTDIAQPWLVGYRRPVFWLDWWEYVDIDRGNAR